ncbi:CHAT domain-containing protein [Cylindrospermum stagnale]|nr:CHAT domain-containing protein [Cylindrospermum stagnale]
MQKLNQRFITTVLLALLGLMIALSIQAFSQQMAIAKKPNATQLICTSTPNLSPEKLSENGRISYEQGRFDAAIDCWKKATDTYSQNGNNTEIINNQINLAQAEQALGLYPRACNTLVQIYGEKDCTSLLQNEIKQKIFFSTLKQKADSPAKITGLRSFGNILRGIGELDLSHEVLKLSLEMTQSQDQTATWLDIGNTRRALSNKEQDLYSRTQSEENLVCAIINAYTSQEAYQKAINETSSNSPSIIPLQAQLNQLSLRLDTKDWLNKIQKETQDKPKKNRNLLERVFQPNYFVKRKQTENCSQQLTDDQSQLPNQIRNWVNQNLSNQNQLQQIDNLQQQIEQLPPSHTALYTRLNFARSLIRFQALPGIDQKTESFLNTTIDQAKNQNNLKAQSYALGYLGKLYEKNQKWELAKTQTRKALLLAQSIPSPDIMYQWQWQLGRIYKRELPAREKANTKDKEKEFPEARSAYAGAFKTLESLRRELATGSPDAQFSFQNDIEGIYREYVDLLLWNKEPSANSLSQARQVIASLQSVELENFLRLACPEYDVKEIDKIIDEKAKNTAFLYPIVLEDRVEVIVKVPTTSTNNKDANQGLKHYSTFIERKEVERQVRQLQIDLEEEYTFDAVKDEGQTVYGWLLKGAEKYLSKDINTLVFALDTNLRNIPLAALVSGQDAGKPQYLVDKYAIALAPRLEIPNPRLLQGKTLTVLAAGLTEPESEEDKQKFPKLRFAKKELDAIKQANPANISVSPLLDTNFRIKNFKNEINTSSFQVLHLATHGEFSSSPEKTFLLTSDEQIVVKEVGNLFRKQAQNQSEPIELLVLSACETAAGDKRATLGISGVAVQAGARSAVASLWSLDDEISVEFTEKFYKQLVDPNLTKAQALQQAQIELKNSPGREHPRYWAPYILLGNWL